MTKGHDFKRFPELTNNQMSFHYFESPHKQIFEDFDAKVVKVHDGDTIRVRWTERDFDFPIRFRNIAAPELKEEEGQQAQNWLEQRILNEIVTIKVNPKKRVEKWGRILGNVIHGGIDVGDEEVRTGLAKTWRGRNEGKIPDLDKILPKLK